MRLLPSAKFRTGSLLIITMIFAAMVLFGSVVVFDNIANFKKFGSDRTRNEQAVQLVEAGVDYALFNIQQNPDFFVNKNYFDHVEGFGPGDFHIRETEHNGNKLITVTGYIPKFGAFEQKATAQVELEYSPSSQSVSFPFALHASGDIDLQSAAWIDTGAVHANGNIDGCCGGYILRIDEHASAQAIDPTITLYDPPPTVPGDNIPLPSLDVEYWKNQAACGDWQNPTPACYDSNGLTISSNQTIEPMMINGNLRIDGEGIVVQVKGPLYITGNIVVGENELKPHIDTGSEGAVIIFDGLINETPNDDVSPYKSNTASPKGLLLFYSTLVQDSCSITLPFKVNVAEYLALAPNSYICLTNSTDHGNQPHLTALAAKKIIIGQLDGNPGIVRFHPDANFSRYSSPGTGADEWRIVRGTYKFTTETICDPNNPKCP